MRKLRLELEEIRVESFGTADKAAARGTVHGEEPTFAYVTCTCDCSDNPACSAEPGCSQARYSCEPSWCVGTQCI